uniref:thioredoxin-dependent peroxiredoxin n=1 Tax=Scleropages formosus TaxID=113540 RepID=A0A8D0CFE9_SCLFO
MSSGNAKIGHPAPYFKATALLWSTVFISCPFLHFRGLFVIDDKGILRQITINDLPVGRSVDETLRLVQAFQHTDKYGEVCPAGWKPGKDTIIPDVQKSKEFFSKQN